MEEDGGDTGRSVSDETFVSTEEEKVAAVAEEPPINTGPRFHMNYIVVWTLSWIFGLIIILIFVLAGWSKNQNRFSVCIQAIIQMEYHRYQFDLNSTQLSFLWRFCNRTTLECSWCPSGWTEHDSRCYVMLNEIETWEGAQELCSRRYHGNLPVVLNARDQMFLSKMAAEFDEKGIVKGVWIGLTDMKKEGSFFWVNGELLTAKASFWQPGNPNNMIPWYDKHGEGQDCAAIVPPENYKRTDWYYTWDDIICRGKRHFICEIQNLSLEAPSWNKVTHRPDKKTKESSTNA